LEKKKYARNNNNINLIHVSKLITFEKKRKDDQPFAGLLGAFGSLSSFGFFAL